MFADLDVENGTTGFDNSANLKSILRYYNMEEG